MSEKDKQQQAAINVYGLANIGCTMENVTFQTLVQGGEAQQTKKSQEPVVNGEDASKMDEVLASDEAKKYWQRLIDYRFVDDDYHLLPETTRKQAMYIAEAFAEKMRMTSKWKPFERLWGIKNLAQEKWDFQQTGTFPTRYKEIDKIFAD